MAGNAVSFPRRLRRRLYWVLASGLLAGSSLVPVAVGRWSGRRLAQLAAKLRPAERRRARRHLRLAFPDLVPAAVDDLHAQAVTALGRNLFDALAAPRLLSRADYVDEEPDRAGEGTVDLLADLLSHGRGLFILTGHLGCWELLGGWLAQRLRERGLPPLAVVTGTIHNPAVDRLVQDRRRGLGLIPLPRREGPRPLLRHLRAGGPVAVLQDQSTGAGSLEIPFFGVPAPTAAGLGRIAMRHGVPVLPIAIAWDPVTRRHLVRHLPPLLPPRAGDRDRAEPALRTFLAAGNACLETFLRRNPAEWVWFHERWPN